MNDQKIRDANNRNISVMQKVLDDPWAGTAMHALSHAVRIQQTRDGVTALLMLDETLPAWVDNPKAPRSQNKVPNPETVELRMAQGKTPVLAYTNPETGRRRVYALTPEQQQTLEQYVRKAHPHMALPMGHP